MKFKIALSFLFMVAFVSLQAQSIHIIPFPNEVLKGQGFYTITPGSKIVSPQKSIKTSKILQKDIQEAIGKKIEIVKSENTEEGAINFIYNGNFKKEQYSLVVSKDMIKIIALDNTGWFYGVQSLLQLFPSIPDSKSTPVSLLKIQEVTINDAPRFHWRGFMLDEGRHFKGKKQVELLLDEMALMKMNVFHWHLTDDQGWRIEIKKYPLLTKIGSRRKSTQIQEGSFKWHSPVQSGEPHEGFYTQKEIKEIVKYASERHITVVPEIEMPGHCGAAIASYPWLGSDKKKIDVPVTFGTKESAYDISDPKVYEFLSDVLKEVMELFPSNVIHIGGDEVIYKQWSASKTIQSYMEKKNINTYAELQIFFTDSISQYLHIKGRVMMGWNEVLGQNIHKFQVDKKQGTANSGDKNFCQLDKKTIIQFWIGKPELLAQAAREGYRIVNSLYTETYVSLEYHKLPLSRAYAFDPIPSNFDQEMSSKIIGIESALWGEWVATKGYMDFLTFPRIAAFAETGWTDKENKNFGRFRDSLTKLKQHWDQKGIYYAKDKFVEKNKK